VSPKPRGTIGCSAANDAAACLACLSSAVPCPALDRTHTHRQPENLHSSTAPPPSPCDANLQLVVQSSSSRCHQAIRALYSSSIRPSQEDSLIYTQFSRTHPSSISSSIHSIHCGTHLSLYLNISMCDLVLKDLLRRI
jgi:hypothetical protein